MTARWSRRFRQVFGFGLTCLAVRVGLVSGVALLDDLKGGARTNLYFAIISTPAAALNDSEFLSIFKKFLADDSIIIRLRSLQLLIEARLPTKRVRRYFQRILERESGDDGDIQQILMVCDYIRQNPVWCCELLMSLIRLTNGSFTPGRLTIRQTLEDTVNRLTTDRQLVESLSQALREELRDELTLLIIERPDHPLHLKLTELLSAVGRDI